MSNSLKMVAGFFLALAAIALIVGGNSPGSSDDLTLTFAEYDAIIKAPVSHTSAIELAEFLMAQSHHYNLIDLQEKHADYLIPTAERHTIASVLAAKIPVNETVIIYAQNETESLQLYYLFLIRGYFKVKILSGGIDAWTRDVLKPSSASISAEQLATREKITRFFGGQIVTTQNPLAADKTLPSPTIHLEKKHRKHGGC